MKMKSLKKIAGKKILNVSYGDALAFPPALQMTEGGVPEQRGGL